MEHIITAENLVKEYRIGEEKTMALDGVSLAINKGEFIAITGKSGSGKSTLLYQLSLLDHPTSGSVFIEGQNASLWNSDTRIETRLFKFGYVFQDYALVPELTALENIMIPRYMSGECQKGCSNRGMDALITVGLSKRENNKPAQLSGGEQQRVSIARALINEPDILFADEPTANLDSETSEKIIDLFKRLNEKGLTVVMVTHEAEYAAQASRVIVMKDGKIIEEGHNS
jgi:putative ABC transport system ATP-binding protein